MTLSSFSSSSSLGFLGIRGRGRGGTQAGSELPYAARASQPWLKDLNPVGIHGSSENGPAIYGWVKRPMNFLSPAPVAPKRSEGGRDGRSLSSLTGLGIFERAKPRAKALGYFRGSPTAPGKSQRDLIIQPSVGRCNRPTLGERFGGGEITRVGVGDWFGR